MSLRSKPVTDAGRDPPGVRAGALSELLEEIARGPADASGAAWDRGLHTGAVFGRYELVREVGRGGFGVVYEAKDLSLGRMVAFKAVRAGREPDFRGEVLLREAEAAARLSHPNIVAVHDVGRSEHGPYLILELLRGETLARRMRRGSLPVGEAVHVATEVAKALAHAHAEGVVHRDLTPVNVFLCRDGQVKVLDFGLAHAFGARKTDGGTPGYMAPEQSRGAPEDERTDVYALGAVLFSMLAGDPPSREGPRPTLEIPGVPALDALVARMLEDDPCARPRDGSEVLAALESVQRELSRAPDAAEAVVVRTRRPSARFRRTAAWFALGTAIAAAGLVAASPAVREHVFEWRGARAAAKRTVAVLPFQFPGGDVGDSAFAAGLSEILTSKLLQFERFPKLQVVSASDVRHERISSAKEARAAFGATHVITGTVQRDHDLVTVAASLIDARTLLVLATREIRVDRSRAGALQRQVVEALVDMLDVDVAPEVGRRVFAEPPVAPGAYAFYLQGRGFLQRDDREENLDSADAVFDRALAHDPAYALALAGKAEVALQRFALTRDPRHLAAARTIAERAAALDEAAPDVQLTIGNVLVAVGDHAQGIQRLERALEIDPANADVHRALGRAYDRAGRTDDAEATYRRAIRLRPESWAAYRDLGVFDYEHGRTTEALPLFQRVVELTPDNYQGYMNLSAIYLLLGMRADAARAIERSLALHVTSGATANLGALHFLEGRYVDAARLFQKATELNPTGAGIWSMLGDAERLAGDRGAAEHAYRRAIALLEQQLAVRPHDTEALSTVAASHAALGERDAAMSAIQRALKLAPHDGTVLAAAAGVYEKAGLRARALEATRAALAAGYSRELIDNDPDMKSLRADPRYAAITDGAHPASPTK